MNRIIKIATRFYLPAILTLSTAAVAEALPRATPALTITTAMIQEAAKAPHAFSSTTTITREPDHIQENIYVVPKNVDHIPNGCANNAGALCYDYRTGSAVYKPMRTLLPELPGMTPHNLSLRRNRVVAQYTFK